MDPRHLILPRRDPERMGHSHRLLIGILTALLLIVAASSAGAMIQSVSFRPSNPLTCDPVTLRAIGLVTACHVITGSSVSGPTLIPGTMGPLDTYVTRGVIRTEPRPGQTYPCIELGMEVYVREFSMGRYPAGHHLIHMVEQRFDSSGVLVDSSAVDTSFVVTRGDSCATSCAFVSFGAPSDSTPTDRCDARGLPGGEACFDILLVNQTPVAGVQLRVRLADSEGNPVPPGALVPKSITTTGRSGPLSLTWEADGAGFSAVLVSMSDAAISPGHGPILHVCYSIAEFATGSYGMFFDQRLVADTEGHEVPPCPTFREETGMFCVGPIAGCDVNGDGIADIRDIVRQVRCVLAGPACDATVAGRSDCNEDGAVDVRDVICCVRKLLQLIPPGDPIPAPAGTPTRIGFAGPGSWETPLEGRASIVVDPAQDFGALGFTFDASPGLRVSRVSVAEGTGYDVQWSPGVDGRVRALLVRLGGTAAGRVTLTVAFERTGSVTPPQGTLRIGSLHGATWDAVLAPADLVADAASIPEAPAATATVYPARPNPFVGTTEIPFALPTRAKASLRIYDVAGRLVRTLFDGEREAGAQRVVWNGRDERGRSVPVGVYFARLSASGTERTARILKMR